MDKGPEQEEEDKAPDTVRDPPVCPTCSYYEKYPTPCQGKAE